LKIISRTDLIDNASLGFEKLEDRVFLDINEAIESVRWPPGNKNFTIHPQSGKKAGQGNGVKPIKEAFAQARQGIKRSGQRRPSSHRFWGSELRSPFSASIFASRLYPM